jgi:hypothetical protein
MEEEKVRVAADVTALGLVTVHGISCLNAEVGEVDGQAVSLPPVMPLSLGDLLVVAMQDLVLDMKPRMAVSQPPSLLHSICTEHKSCERHCRTVPPRANDLRMPASPLGSTRVGSPLECSF